MRPSQSLDLLVEAPAEAMAAAAAGLKPASGGRDAWLRGRPADGSPGCNPFLKLPGSTRWRTLPDGLWLNFGGTPVDPYVDIFAIEACGSLQNLLDKRVPLRAQHASLLAVCPVPWLMAPVMPRRPDAALEGHRRPVAQEPVRAVRAAGPRHARDVRPEEPPLSGFVRHQLPHAHEYFVPMEALTAEDGDKDPALRALLARASAAANFLSQPGRHE